MMMQKQRDKLQADEATLITEWRTCWQEKHAELSMPHPKPQCKKLDAGVGKSFAHHRPTLTKKHTKCRHTVKSAFHKPGRPKWMPEMPKGIKPGKEGFFTPLIFV